MARELRRAMPNEDLLYLGDTARVPYGTKSAGAVIRFSLEAGRFLLGQGVKAIVVACNTASAHALEALQRDCSVPVFGVVLPGARAALAASRGLRIGVIATASTVRSGVYEAAIRRIAPSAMVVSRACPLLVPLAEEGWLDHAVTRQVIRIYLRPILRRRVDTLVLGCTHYPLLRRALRREAGGSIALVDSASSCAFEVSKELKGMGLCSRRRRPGTFRARLTDDAPAFAHLAASLLGVESAAPLRVSLQAIPAQVGH